MRYLQEIGKGIPKHFTALSYLALFLEHHPDWFFYDSSGASLMPQTVKNLLAMQETLIQSLCQKDPLENGMATHSSILLWRIPWTEEPVQPKSMVLHRVRHDCATNILPHIMIPLNVIKLGFTEAKIVLPFLLQREVEVLLFFPGTPQTPVSTKCHMEISTLLTL